MKDNRQDELTYNDKWRHENPAEAAAADVLKAFCQKQHCTHIHKLDDWKLMIFASAMESYNQRYNVPRLALIHFLDMLFAVLECQTVEQTEAMASKEADAAMKRQLDRILNTLR